MVQFPMPYGPRVRIALQPQRVDSFRNRFNRKTQKATKVPKADVLQEYEQVQYRRISPVLGRRPPLFFDKIAEF